MEPERTVDAPDVYELYTRPHTPECFVYRYARALIGADRRGLCDCGAEVKQTEVKPEGA